MYVPFRVFLTVHSINFLQSEGRASLSTINPLAESTPSSVFIPDFPTPRASVYCPTDDSPTLVCTPLDKLNTFLGSRDISPVRHTMQTKWEEASERTKRRHTRKAKQAVTAVLEEVAPNQSEQLWQTLVASKSLEQDGSNKDVDEVLMEALAECYRNANNWQTRRQIWSIMADKISYNMLQKWIPDLTRYRFSEARRHILIEVRGVLPLPDPSRTRMAISQTQLDHFLDFITSPHVIQDLPYGEKSIKLSTKEIITVPNVVRMMIPESIVKQYLIYAEECAVAPLSRSTLLRILSICSASVRKSLQGVDYISSAGSQAFDDLSHVVDRLGEEVMGMSWAKEQNERLKAAKRYLKGDFKVKNVVMLVLNVNNKTATLSATIYFL